MKHLFTLLALTIGFSMNAQVSIEGTEASGQASTAMGYLTEASGITSTAMGYDTTAIGNASTAMGYLTTASDYGSLVIGLYNLAGLTETTIGVSAGRFSLANTAFVIGNGTVDVAKDAFKVMFNGNTTASGSVTATEFIGNGSQLTNLPFSLNDTSGNGIQSNTNTASGDYSTAMGFETKAEGAYSTAMGYKTEAEGNSTAMGKLTKASGIYSTAMGNDTEASGAFSTAMGNGTKAEGTYSTAMGRSTTASGGFSTAMGRSTIASANYSTAMGNETTANGYVSTAMGYRTTASDYGSLVIGQYNDAGSAATSDTSFSLENTAFVIGRGESAAARLDAFKVMFNGNTTVGNDLTVNGNVMVSSDARLKANIVSLGATLAKLLLIDGKSYTMKKDGKQKIGVLAQDIQKVFPELVSTDDRDMLAVNYQGLVPVLINALKEQQSDIDELKEQAAKMKEQDAKLKEQGAKMKEQQKRLERLEAIISKMDK